MIEFDTVLEHFSARVSATSIPSATEELEESYFVLLEQASQRRCVGSLGVCSFAAMPYG